MTEHTADLLPSRMTLAEHEFLIGDGSLAGAIAGDRLRFVYCECGLTFPASEWRAHQGESAHDAFAFERPADYITDCLVFPDRGIPRSEQMYETADR